MKLFFRLLGLIVNQRFGISALRAGLRDDRRRTITHGFVYVVAVLSIGMLVGMYTWLAASVLPAFQALHIEHILLGLVLLMAMVFVFFMGMFYLIGVLFFSKDTEFLAALPIPHRTVFAAKFTQVLIGETGTALLMLLPLFVVYGVKTGANALFYARAAIVMLLAPCIPLALSGLLSLVLMRFSALWRRRDLLTIIGSVLLIVLVIAGEMFLSTAMPEVINEEAMMALITSSEGILSVITAAFPPSGWAAQGLLGNGGMLLLFVAVSSVSLLSVVYIAGRIYYSGASAQLESAATRRKVSLSGRAVRRRGATLALFAREWRLMLRTPVYALNGLTVIVVGPLLLLMPLLSPGGTSGEQLDLLFSLLERSADPRFLALIMAGVFCFVGMINPAVSTSISREGKTFYMLRMIPVSPGKQVLAKYLFGLSISVLAMLLMGIMGVIGLRLPPLPTLGGFLLGTLACICPTALSFLPDVLRPKLNWNSETEAIKQNFNAVFGMLAGWLYVVAIVALCAFALSRGMSVELLFSCIAVLCTVLGGAGLFALIKAAKRSFRMIEG